MQNQYNAFDEIGIIVLKTYIIIFKLSFCVPIWIANNLQLHNILIEHPNQIMKQSII